MPLGPLRSFRVALHHRKAWLTPEAVKRKILAQGLQKLNENMVTMAEPSELAIRKAVDNIAQPNPTVLDEILALDPEIYGL